MKSNRENCSFSINLLLRILLFVEGSEGTNINLNSLSFDSEFSLVGSKNHLLDIYHLLYFNRSIQRFTWA